LIQARLSNRFDFYFLLNINLLLYIKNKMSSRTKSTYIESVTTKDVVGIVATILNRDRYVTEKQVNDALKQIEDKVGKGGEENGTIGAVIDQLDAKITAIGGLLEAAQEELHERITAMTEENGRSKSEVAEMLQRAVAGFNESIDILRQNQTSLQRQIEALGQRLPEAPPESEEPQRELPPGVQAAALLREMSKQTEEMAGGPSETPTEEELDIINAAINWVFPMYISCWQNIGANIGAIDCIGDMSNRRPAQAYIIGMQEYITQWYVSLLQIKIDYISKSMGLSAMQEKIKTVNEMFKPKIQKNFELLNAIPNVKIDDNFKITVSLRSAEKTPAEAGPSRVLEARPSRISDEDAEIVYDKLRRVREEAEMPDISKEFGNQSFTDLSTNSMLGELLGIYTDRLNSIRGLIDSTPNQDNVQEFTEFAQNLDAVLAQIQETFDNHIKNLNGTLEGEYSLRWVPSSGSLMRIKNPQQRRPTSTSSRVDPSASSQPSRAGPSVVYTAPAFSSSTARQSRRHLMTDTG
jgi:hypothetical protein